MRKANVETVEEFIARHDTKAQALTKISVPDSRSENRRKGVDYTWGQRESGRGTIIVDDEYVYRLTVYRVNRQ